MPTRVPERKVSVYYNPPHVSPAEIEQIRRYYTMDAPMIMIIRKLQPARTVANKPALSYVDIYTILYTLMKAGKLKQRTTHTNEMTIEQFAKFFFFWKSGASYRECKAVIEPTKATEEFCTTVFRTTSNRYRDETRKRIALAGVSEDQVADLATFSKKTRAVGPLLVAKILDLMTREGDELRLKIADIPADILEAVCKFFPGLTLKLLPGVATDPRSLESSASLRELADRDAELREVLQESPPPDMIKDGLAVEDADELSGLDPDGLLAAEGERLQNIQQAELERRKAIQRPEGEPASPVTTPPVVDQTVPVTSPLTDQTDPADHFTLESLLDNDDLTK